MNGRRAVTGLPGLASVLCGCIINGGDPPRAPVTSIGFDIVATDLAPEEPETGLGDLVPPAAFCETTRDCAAQAGPCETARCVDGRCEVSPADAGAPVPAHHQTPGDCVRLSCGEGGAILAAADPRDTPAEDLASCTVATCDGGTPTVRPMDAGLACRRDTTDGTYGAPGLCDGAGRCVACLGDARRCDVRGDTVERCEAGAWALTERCTGRCVEGACVGACSPGDTRCEAGAFERCDVRGAWLLEATCPHRCEAEGCVGVCRPGDRRCAGTAPERCDDAGQWMPDGAACGGEKPFCRAGACLQVLPATRRIEPGRFGMGRAYFENGNLGEEGGPVVLTRPFALTEAEVTQAEWEAISGGGRPAFFAGCGGDCPVEQVSWWSVLAFANALSAAHGLTPCFVIPTEHPRGGPCGGRWQDGTLDCGAAEARTTATDPYACTGWRLPTEAEWEYAARAGTTTPTYGGAAIPDPDTCQPSGTAFDELAWWCANAAGATHPVRGRTPNAWGLHDMLGNVAEWTWDVFTSHATGWGAVVTDPHASVVDQYLGRVVRGGHWGSRPRHVRSAARGDERPWQRSPVLGFRLARTLEP